MNPMKLIVWFMALFTCSVTGAQTLTSGMADGNTPHTSSGSSVVSSSSSGSTSSYSTSGTAPSKARPEEAFAYQLQQANQIAIAINARRMQNINAQIRSIQFSNPFKGGEPETGFTDWNKEKSKFETTDNQDYSTLSSQHDNGRSYSSMPGYVDLKSVMSTMKPAASTDFSEKQVLEKSREDIEKEHLMEVADETIDKTIDEIEDDDVQSRMKSIKEIHNESYDLFEKMIDAFFRPYPKEIEEMIDRFFGDYESSVLQSFAKANSNVRENAEVLEKYGHIGELIFKKDNSKKQ